MPKLPYLRPRAQTRRTTDSFLGYDHRARIAEGAMYDMENLSSRACPLLATRPRRGTLQTLAAPGGMIAKDALAWVDGGTLYYNSLPTGLTGLSGGEKQLVSMGAYLLVFPDKCYLNTADLTDFGSMEAHYVYTGPVTYTPCHCDGTPLPDAVTAESEPENPSNGDMWLDSVSGTLMQYSEAQLMWVELETPYTRLDFTTEGQLPALFAQYDGVTVSGAGELDGEKILYAVSGGEGGDSLVLVGLTPAAYTVGNARVELDRTLPDMDYVCQCRNRLWGCRYGLVNGETVNEIYASALGDFKNFRQYLGLATDSWTASCGSDGVFTGAVSFLDSPVFFKENVIHRVTVSSTGAHRLSESACRGVQKGSAKSLAVVGDTLYYKSRQDVCAWQGGIPQSVSRPLGDESYRDAVGGAFGSRYYLSMLDAAGESGLFVYDTDLKLWHREDGFRPLCFAEADGELYAIEQATGALTAMTGKAGTPEAALPWRFETGLLSYALSGEKCVSRYHLRLSLEPGCSATAWIEYDSDGVWHNAGTITAPASSPSVILRSASPSVRSASPSVILRSASDEESPTSDTGDPSTPLRSAQDDSGVQSAPVFPVLLPVRPRRCDHLRLRLTGTGELRLHAISRIVEGGSDVVRTAP